MDFFKDRYLEIPVTKTYKELIEAFLKNEKAYKLFLKEKNFEKAFLLTMPGIPKSVLILCEDWNALKMELKSQDKTINFNF